MKCLLKSKNSPQLAAGTIKWGIQRGRASPLVASGVNTPLAKCLVDFAVAVFFLCLVSQAFAAQDQDNAVIERFIAAQARGAHGEEFKDARKIVAGDVNRDGSADSVVLFTLEGQHGSNNYPQILAVFLRAQGKLVPIAHTEVGGKTYRSVELISVDADGIHLQTMDYAASDPACCPSITGKTRYQLVGGKLREL